MISIFVAAAKNNVIGNQGDLPWRLKSDLARFKELTMGHPVIMGRKTYESIPEKFRPLPGRTNIVITRGDQEFPGALKADSLANAFRLAQKEPGADEIFVIGGGQVYEQSVPFASRIYFTRVDAELEGDTFFPQLDAVRWKKKKAGAFKQDENHEYSGTFYIFNRTNTYPITEPSIGRSEEYRADLTQILESGICPFCPGGKTLQAQKIEHENDSWYLTHNYVPLKNTMWHFLLIPKRHVEKREHLKQKEVRDLWSMQKWIDDRYQGTGSVLYGRSGEPKSVGATVAHIHFQLIIPAGYVEIGFGPYPQKC